MKKEKPIESERKQYYQNAILKCKGKIRVKTAAIYLMILLANFSAGTNLGNAIANVKLADLRTKVESSAEYSDEDINKEIEESQWTQRLLKIKDSSQFYEMSREEQLSYIKSVIRTNANEILAILAC